MECNENANLQTITGLTDCTAITYLNCDDCKIADLSAVNSMGNLEELYCRNNQLTSLTVSNKSKLKTIDAHGNPSLTQARVYNNPLLTTFKIYNCTAMRTLTCTGNSKLSSISLTGNTGLVNLYCSNNKLTSLNVQGCSSLTMIQCCNNQITESGMTTLVNSLPTRSSSSRGTLDVLYNSDEGNVFTSAHASIAKSKYWSPCRWNGSAWVEIEGAVAGDLNGDGVLNATDLTLLISLVMYGNPSASINPAADYNGDGVINATDVTMLITYVMGH